MANRAQYQRLLPDCEKNKFEIILIHKYNRIARNLLEHVTLEQKLKAQNILLIATAQDFGAPMIHMEVVDKAAKDYLHKLLNKENVNKS